MKIKEEELKTIQDQQTSDILFEDKDQSYNIYITKNNEILPWKKFNANMSISVEYDLKY
jgi:hypothetical protein